MSNKQLKSIELRMNTYAIKLQNDGKKVNKFSVVGKP